MWLLSGMYAKYVTSDKKDAAAHVASTGVEQFALLEHKATLQSGVYVLGSEEVTKNAYDRVIPGVDIEKDPFVRLKLQGAEVDFELYLQVTESVYFPQYVTYELTAEWEVVDADNGIYKYTGYFDAGTQYDKTIQILKENKLYVSEHYDADTEAENGKTFALTFEAWLRQVD